MPNGHLAAAREAIERAVEGLSPETIAREIPNRWSIGDILEHLTLAFTVNAAVLGKALASGELRARAPTLTTTLIRMLVVDVGYFPRAKAPEMTRPTRSIPPERSVSALLEALSTLDATLRRVSERFGDDVRVANHPYFSGLTVPQWRKFHWRHTVHHMKQVRERSER
jgi:hypothetical protein